MRLSRPRRGRLAAVAIFALFAAIGAVVGITASGEPEPLPEAGSRFGATAEEREGGTLLDALAGVLAPATAQRRTERERGGGRGDRAGAAAVRRAPGQAAAGLLLVGFGGTEASATFFERLLVRPFGGVLLTRSNYVDPQQIGALAGEVQVVARNAGHPAPLIGARQEGGELNVFPDLPPRGQVELAGEGAAAIRAQARAAGRQLRALGVGMTFAPVADLAVAGGPAQGRAYSDDPRAVARAVQAAVTGYRRAGLAPVVGAFPGEGAAAQDPAEGPAPVGLALDELRRRDMLPFAAIARGPDAAPAVQMSNAIYLAFDGVTPATLLPEAVDELRKRIGFRGVVVSGDLVAATATTGGTVGEAAVQALRAGCDLVVVPGGQAEQEQAYRQIVGAIRRGELPAGRVARALRRVARLRAFTRATREPATPGAPAVPPNG